MGAPGAVIRGTMRGVEVPSGLHGRRVALRHRLADGLLTDAVGELDGGGDPVVVHTRRGPVVVERAAVVAVRAIPPPVPRRASWTAVARLENLCADAWPARADRRLGAWRLRAAGGFTGRANAALALGDPGRPVAAALDAARAFAAGHGVEPRVHVPLGSRWDRAVEAEGWVLDVGHEAGAEVAVLVADVDRLAHLAPRSHTAVGDPQEQRYGSEVRWSERPTSAWWDLSLRRDPTPDERTVLDPGPPLRTAFGIVPAAGVVRAAVVDDHVHLSRLAVAPEARRAGVGTRLTAAAAAWGAQRGARWAVLQVPLHNTAARAFYDRVGATEHHRYRYLVPPAG